VYSSGVKPDLPAVPDGVEVERRSGQGISILLIENFSPNQQTIALPEAMTDVLAGGFVHRVILPAYGVAILSQPIRGEASQK